MATNKTQPTDVPVEAFLATVPTQRANDSLTLIPLFEKITGQKPVMWGPSIIGFGSQDYETSRGAERMPLLAFSPRKASVTIYFLEGFNHYGKELEKLGPHKASSSCLYLTRLEKIDLAILEDMLTQSYARCFEPLHKIETVEDYIAQVPAASREQFHELRALVAGELPAATQKLSYGIVGFVPEGKKRADVFVSGWKDHVAMYPIPKDLALRTELATHQKGKGTLWFPLDQPLPEDLIRRVVRALSEG